MSVTPFEGGCTASTPDNSAIQATPDLGYAAEARRQIDASTLRTIGAVTLVDAFDEAAEKYPEALLDGMRAWLRTNSGRMARGKIPVQYEAVHSSIERIHEAYMLSDPQSPLEPHTPARLLTNLIRYQQACGRDDPTALGDTTALSQLYSKYANDAKVFSEHGVAKAGDVVLYHAPELLTELDQSYGGHEFIGHGDINKAFIRNRRNPGEALENLVQAVRQFKETVEPALRQEYDNPGSWSLKFVKNLCEASDPMSLARRIFATTQELCAKYPRTRQSAIEWWVQEAAIDGGKKATLVKDLHKEFPVLLFDEQSKAQGATQLDQLRQAHIAGRIRPMPNPESPLLQRFLHTLDTNWQESFDTFDVEQAAGHFFFAVQQYNKAIRRDGTQQPIGEDPQSLYNILLVYAADVAALKENGPDWAATTVARFHGPDVYDTYVKRYEDTPLLKPGMIRSIVSQFPGSIDSHITERIDRMQELVNTFGTKIRPRSVYQFAQYSDAKDRVRACLTFMDGVREVCDWVAPYDVERFFTTSETPQKDFWEWANKVEEINRLRPDDGPFTRYICKVIARNDGEPSEIINDYLGRIADITTEHQGSPFVTVEFAKTWAARSPKSYKEVARACVRRVPDIERLLAQADVEADFEIVRYLAFSNNDPEARVGKYLELRQTLEAKRDEDENIEQWMIDQAAAFSNTARFARMKLGWLSYLKRQGVFALEIDSVSDSNRSPHETVEGFAFASPEAAMIMIETTRERQIQVEKYLSQLTLVDRRAVELVFGFSSRHDRSALQEELGVENLDDYVLQDVVPRLRTK